MNSPLRWVVLFALGAILAVPALAQSTMDQLGGNRIVSIGIGGGVYVPVGDATAAF